MSAPPKRARLLKNLLLLLLQFLSLRPPVHNFEHLRLFRDFPLALSSSSLPREGRGRGYRRAHLSSSSFPLLPSPVAPSHRPNGGTPANFEGVRVRRKRKRKRPASEVGEKRRAASLLLFPLFLAGRPKTYRPTVRWECARGKKERGRGGGGGGGGGRGTAREDATTTEVDDKDAFCAQRERGREGGVQKSNHLAVWRRS